MPKQKKIVKFISNELSEVARKLIDTTDRRNIAIKLNCSLGYVNAVIYQTRYNKEIEVSLMKLVKSKLKKLTK